RERRLSAEHSSIRKAIPLYQAPHGKRRAERFTHKQSLVWIQNALIVRFSSVKTTALVNKGHWVGKLLQIVARLDHCAVTGSSPRIQKRQQRRLARIFKKTAAKRGQAVSQSARNKGVGRQRESRETSKQAANVLEGCRVGIDLHQRGIGANATVE